jgi:hypothetical protein
MSDTWRSSSGADANCCLSSPVARTIDQHKHAHLRAHRTPSGHAIEPIGNELGPGCLRKPRAHKR